MLNKVIILVLFAQKVISLFHKITIEPLMSHGVFHLCPYYVSCALIMVIPLLSMEGPRALKNILICVPKINKGPTGLEQH